MSHRHRLAIFGTGGHAREAAWIAESSGYGRDELVFVVDAAYRTSDRVNGIDVLDLEQCSPLPCVVAIGDPATRAAIRTRCTARGFSDASLIAPGIALHDTVTLGSGVVMAAGVVVTVNVMLGNDVHLNVGASISHDVSVGNFTTLSPGARVAGHVRIGESVFIGTNATIINGTPGHPLHIGDRAIIAAGACVIGSVGAGATMIGVPARARL